MPSVRKTEMAVWGCMACGKQVEVVKDGELMPHRPGMFSVNGTIRISSASLDYQGAAVGPGWLVDGDLCDSCLLSLKSWFERRAEGTVERGERSDRKPDDPWEPGMPCGQCGSVRTYVDDDGNPACKACGATDGDE